MRSITRFFVVSASVVALATLVGATGGCGRAAEKPTMHWERVLSTRISGAQPVKLNLGTFRLGDQVRLAWVLSGPEKPPVTLTCRVTNVDTGTGYGKAVSPRSGPGVTLHDDQAMTLAPIPPGTYRIHFSQRFRPARGPGYDIELTISTMR